MKDDNKKLEERTKITSKTRETIKKNRIKKLTIIVIDLVSSSIIMLPYCKSLWQKPMSWQSSDSFFSNMLISSSKVSNPKSFLSFTEHKVLASLSQFLL